MRIPISILLLVFTISTGNMLAQEKALQWDLNACINYALQNNIRIQQSKISLEQNAISTKQAKAQLFPSLTASINQTFTNSPYVPSNVYNGSYGISSSMTLFDGGKTLNNIEQQKLVEKTANYAVLESEKDIQMSILQNYLQILYADESVKINQTTLDVSAYQMKRAQELLKAGSISKADLAQIESQYSSDKYQLTVSENNLRSYKLQLKQLLELSLNEAMDIVIPEINSMEILKPLPSLQSVYETALQVMPQVGSSNLEVVIAGLETEKAKAGYLPKISLNASIGTSNISDSNLNFSDQLQDRLNEMIGISVNIPIFTNRENKSAVEKARLSEKTSQLNLFNTEKELLSEIESVYQDAISAQSQYMAALEKERALKISYELVEQQYTLGMKNTLELLTEKNNLIAAQQNLLQTKYMSLMNIQLLNLYQDIALEIN